MGVSRPVAATGDPYADRMTTAVGLNPDVAVVVPAFNEESSVGAVVSDLSRHFRTIICVDDGSSDATADAAARAGATVVRHPENLGQGAALQTGFAYALADPLVDFIITFDSDGQHRVDDALTLLDAARSHQVDVVLGSRFLGPAAEVPFLRRQVLRAAVRFTRYTTGMALTDTHNGLRVLQRRAIEAMDLTLTGMAHASQLLDQVSRSGLSYVEAPVTIEYTDYSRARGQSNVNALNIAFDLAVERLRGRR